MMEYGKNVKLECLELLIISSLTLSKTPYHKTFIPVKLSVTLINILNSLSSKKKNMKIWIFGNAHFARKRINSAKGAVVMTAPLFYNNFSNSLILSLISAACSNSILLANSSISSVNLFIVSLISSSFSSLYSTPISSA